ITPVLGFDRARALPRSGGAGQWPDLVAGCSSNPVLGDPNGWFDVGCFALPAAGTIGNLGRNTVRGPGYATLDAALFKNLPLGRAPSVVQMFVAQTHAAEASENGCVLGDADDRGAQAQAAQGQNPAAAQAARLAATVDTSSDLPPVRMVVDPYPSFNGVFVDT